MAQDLLQEAKEAYDDCRDEMREQHARMREDARFSNPADPKQWDDEALTLRRGRPCLTFDRTNQFIMQVVNDGRQNRPSIKVIPADAKAADEVAQKLNGMFRHIEYVSRAGAAYDMALECAARVGLGWVRVIPQIMRPETNEQEVRILRVHDPLSVMLQAGWTQADGSDAMHGFAETILSEDQFRAIYPKAALESWEGKASGWFTEDSIRVAEYFKVEETKQNNILAQHRDGKQIAYTEDDYWKHAVPQGAKPLGNFESKSRKVRWVKMSGCEILEETEFPSQYIPLVPCMGYEMWIDGDRYLCGLTRRLRDGQKAYNYERSAFIESVAMQPKAPFLVPFEGIEDFELDWKALNSGNPAYLPYNAYDEKGQPIPAPSRLNPPALPVAFAQGGQIATQDMESAVGMFKSNLGQQSNAVSGKAKLADQREGDTATYHFHDNQGRMIEQIGRIGIDMIGRIYDTQRQARIVGEDGAHDFVGVNPEMGQAFQKEGKKTVSINPGIGAYDVRVEVGPSHASMREEAAQNIVDLSQGNPELANAMAPMLIKLRNMPEAEKMARVAMALLPPQIQAAYEDDEGDDIPPEALSKIQELSAAKDQLSHALEQAHAEHTDLENQVKAGTQSKMMQLQAQGQIEQDKHQREVEFERMKAGIAMQAKAIEERMQDKALANALRIAELNASVVLAGQGTDAAQAQQALVSEHILEGQRIAVDKEANDQKIAADMHKHQTTLDAQSQSQDKALASSEKIAKSKPKPTAKA